MQCILNHPRAAEHVILIDDARLFVGKDDYPTLHALKQMVLTEQPNWNFEVKDDIIRTYSDT